MSKKLDSELEMLLIKYGIIKILGSLSKQYLSGHRENGKYAMLNFKLIGEELGKTKETINKIIKGIL